MVPENKQPMVKNALQTAFGVSDYEEIEEMTKGLSNALTYRIVVKGKAYLLKVARTDELSSPAKYYEYMKAGAEAGIAPKIWYLNVQDKISITDFIEKKPFPISKAKEIMPKLLSRLHSLPPFHKANNNHVMDGMVQRFISAKFISDELTEKLIASYTRIKNIYPFCTNDLVSCHNDLKPENFIFDGERTWLIDWEAAFLNDRYLDLSIISNFIVNNDEDEIQYLQIYSGKKPDKYTHAKFFLARQLLHVYYTSIFMLYASKTIPIKGNTIGTDFKDFHDRMWAGEIDLADDQNKLLYAFVHMDKFLANINTERFECSLEVISENLKEVIR
jgi:thiamine kinase-like enzyme